MDSLRLENIKSFRDSGTVEIKPITIFVGKNSCGKSSLLRFPVVLSQTFQANENSSLALFGKMIDYGNFEEVINVGQVKNKQIAFSMCEHMRVDVDSVLDFNDRLRPSETEYADVTIRTCLSKNDTIYVVSSELSVNGKKKCKISIEPQNEAYSFTLYDGQKKKVYKIKELSFKHFIPWCPDEKDLKKKDGSSCIEGMMYEEYINCMSYADVTQANGNLAFDPVKGVLHKKTKLVFDQLLAYRYCSMLYKKMYEKCEKDFKNTKYIGPFRKAPERSYRDAEYDEEYVGTQGENLSQFLINVSQKSEYPEWISKSLQQILGVNIALRKLGDGIFKIVVIDSKGIESNLMDTGYGISMVLPVVTQAIKCALDENESMQHGLEAENSLIIEEPELHLHPAAQAGLADLFVNCALVNNKSKYIIETHSEHLIRKLQVLVADSSNPFTWDMVKFYYVDKDENGEAFISEMEIAENGRFKTKWPSGFFDEGFILAKSLSSLN